MYYVSPKIPLSICYAFDYLVMMSLIDSILHAASVLSSNLSNVDTQDLLSHHRHGLQSALQILERTLSSPSLRSAQDHESTSSTDSTLYPSEVPVLSHHEVCLPTNEAQRQHDDSEALNVQTPSSSDLRITLSNHDRVDQQAPQLPKQLDEVSSFMRSLQRRSKKIHTFAKKDVEEAISRGSNWSEQGQEEY